jgi:hypothetical protein
VLRIRHHLDADQDPACHFVADPDPSFHFDADPDPTFHYDADPDPDPSFQIKAQSLKTVLKQAHIPYIFACQLQNANPDPAYHINAEADPDPTFQFDADPDPQHCCMTMILFYPRPVLCNQY